MKQARRPQSLRRAAVAVMTVAMLAHAGPVVRAAPPASLTDLRVALSNPVELASSSYSISFRLVSDAGLKAGDTVTFTAPQGTDFDDGDTGWALYADDSPVLLAEVTGSSSPDGHTRNRVTLRIATPIPSGAAVSVVASWVTNPGPSKHHRVTAGTNLDESPVPSSVYSINGDGRVVWMSYEAGGTGGGRCWGSATATGDCATRSYMVYAPKGNPRARQALIVDLHGCFTTAATEARWSRLHKLAGEHGFVAMYPQQAQTANGGRCWNWFDPDHQHRDRGEPALIAGMVRDVIQRYRIDRGRVYILGISAGGAMANILLVTYPDLFAAGATLAGCQYEGLPCMGAASAQPYHLAAQRAVAEMGPRLRSVPVFALTGDVDTVVPAPNAEQIVQQWLATDSIRRTGSPSPTPLPPSERRHVSSPGERPYTDDTWRDIDGCTLARRWTVHGMGHQWPGAPSNGSPQDLTVADPMAPDLREALIEFFQSHPMPFNERSPEDAVVSSSRCHLGER